MRRVRVASGLWATLLAVSATAAAADPTVLAAGPRGGLAWQVGAGERARALAVEAVETRGSRQSLALVEEGAADFAIVQEDLFREHLAARRRAGAPSRARAVERLYFRYLSVLVRRPLYVESVRDLPRLRVWIGEPDGDGRAAVYELLERVGLPSPDAVAAPCPARWPGEGLAALRRCFAEGALDVALVLKAPGEPALAGLAADGVAAPASLDYRALRLLVDSYDAERPYRFASLGEVQTVAVPVLLVAGREVSAAGVEAVARALEETAGELLAARGAPGAPAGEALSAAGLPLAAWWRDEPTALPAWAWTLLVLGGFAAGLLVLGRALGRSRRRPVRRLRRNMPLLLTLLVLPSAALLVTILTYLAEHRVNEHFSTPAESFWSITIYVFSGLEDRSPFTALGKASAALGLLLGPVLFTVATGWVASLFIRRERKMPGHLKDHYLILNWNERAARIVEQLHHPVIVGRRGVSVIVVLTDDTGVSLARLRESGLGTHELYEDIYVSLGDPTSERALLNANAQDAAGIVVLADERAGEHADERTLRSLFMLRRLARQRGCERLHVVAEILDGRNQPVCDEMARDFPGLLETVSGGEVRACLLAQAALEPGIVGFFRDLFSVSEETNEVYSLAVPPEAAGMTFGDYATLVLARRGEQATPVLPVGISRAAGGRSQVLCNPRAGEAGERLRAGDRLVVLA
ncbi:MAG TPA: TAXI family TRAP transporter solute-binding subunit, partial [Thermoanaerobaculia bacterium]